MAAHQEVRPPLGEVWLTTCVRIKHERASLRTYLPACRRARKCTCGFFVHRPQWKRKLASSSIYLSALVFGIDGVAVIKERDVDWPS